MNACIRAQANAKQYRTAAEENAVLAQKLRESNAKIARLQTKLDKHIANRESVQQHRHDANRYLEQMQDAIADAKRLENLNETLESAAATAVSRSVLIKLVSAHTHTHTLHYTKLN